jgi:hypothetical protein
VGIGEGGEEDSEDKASLGGISREWAMGVWQVQVVDPTAKQSEHK